MLVDRLSQGHPKPIQKPVINGGRMELKMHMAAQHIQLVSPSCRVHSALICFPVPWSTFHLAVTDDVVGKEKQKSLLQYKRS